MTALPIPSRAPLGVGGSEEFSDGECGGDSDQQYAREERTPKRSQLSTKKGRDLQWCESAGSLAFLRCSLRMAKIEPKTNAAGNQEQDAINHQRKENGPEEFGTTRVRRPLAAKRAQNIRVKEGNHKRGGGHSAGNDPLPANCPGEVVAIGRCKSKSGQRGKRRDVPVPSEADSQTGGCQRAQCSGDCPCLPLSSVLDKPRAGICDAGLYSFGAVANEQRQSDENKRRNVSRPLRAKLFRKQ